MSGVDTLALAHAALLVGVGILGGFANTIAGGGSAVMVPALILAGLPAGVANGTSRLAILLQSTSGALTYARGGKVGGGDVVDVVPMTVLGAVAGAWTATMTPDWLLEPLLLGTMAVMTVVLVGKPSWLAPAPGAEPRRAGRSPAALALLFAAGFYGGLLQVGAGFVLLALLGGFLRRDLVRANALKVIIVAVYTAFALVVFVARGKMAWLPAVELAAGSMVGGWLGARFAMRSSAEAVRRVLVVMIVVTCAYALAR